MLPVLYIDIDTTPILAWNWMAYGDQNALKIEQDWKLLGFCYAWGDGKVQSVYPEAEAYWDSTQTQGSMISACYDLFDEAAVVVAHNGDRFDIRKMRAKFIEHGLLPHSPILSIDTMKIARREFGFSRNSLDHVATLFGFGGKYKHSGYQMWTGCMEGVPEYWDEMEHYNDIDVVKLRQVYLHMRAWDTRHPNVGLGESCSKCGSFDLMKRGMKSMKSGLKRQQYQCNNCGGYSTELKSGAVRA